MFVRLTSGEMDTSPYPRSSDKMKMMFGGLAVHTAATMQKVKTRRMSMMGPLGIIRPHPTAWSSVGSWAAASVSPSEREKKKNWSEISAFSALFFFTMTPLLKPTLVFWRSCTVAVRLGCLGRARPRRPDGVARGRGSVSPRDRIRDHARMHFPRETCEGSRFEGSRLDSVMVKENGARAPAETAPTGSQVQARRSTGRSCEERGQISNRPMHGSSTKIEKT